MKRLIFLKSYSWPGNVRELQNTIEYAMNMETDSIIQYENLPERLKILEKSGQTIADIEKKDD